MTDASARFAADGPMNSSDHVTPSRRHFLKQLAVTLAGIPALTEMASASAAIETPSPPNEGKRMKPRITVITVGVDDLDRALRFYRDGLGLKTDGIIGQEFEHGAVAFFDLEGGARLAIWPRKSIAHDTGLTVTDRSATEFTLGRNVRSTEEVDAVMAQAKKAGATIVKPAAKTFWGGYAGYFQDPDGHLWEVLWNPQFMPKE